MTGCAAVLLECNAKTVHSWAGIGLANGDDIEEMASKVADIVVIKEEIGYQQIY